MVMNLGIVAIIYFGGIRVDGGSITQGELTAFINYMTQILLALVVLANLIVTFTKAIASANRIKDIFECKNEIISGNLDSVDKNAEKYGSLSLILKSTTPVSIITIRSTMIVITANGIRNLSFFIPHSAYFLRSSSVYKTGR